MPYTPLTQSDAAAVVAAGGSVTVFDLDNRLTHCLAPNGGRCCLVSMVLEFADIATPPSPPTEPLQAHQAYQGATLAQGISEALKAPRVIRRTCRCLVHGTPYSVQIQSKVEAGTIKGVVMVCRPSEPVTE